MVNSSVVWMDLNNDKCAVPLYQGKIYMKVVRISWLASIWLNQWTCDKLTAIQKEKEAEIDVPKPVEKPYVKNKKEKVIPLFLVW